MVESWRAALYAMAKARSGESSRRRASRRSRSTRARRLEISFSLVRWRRTRLAAKSFVKLIFISQDEEFGSTKHGVHKMLLGSRLGGEFLSSTESNIDRAVEASFRLPQGRRQFRESELADDKEIHVALCLFLAPSKRAIHEGPFHLVLERLEPPPEDIDEPHGLQDNAAQLREYRRARFGLEINLAAANAAS